MDSIFLKVLSGSFLSGDVSVEDLYQAFKYRLMQELAAEKPGEILAEDGYGRQLCAEPELLNLVDKDQS